MVDCTGLADISLRRLLRNGELLLVRQALQRHTLILHVQASLILGLANLGNPSYEIKGWHETLLTMGIVIFCVIFNVLLAVRMPLIETLVLVLHVLGVFVVIIPLWVMAPRGNAHDTILVFVNEGGWHDLGLACTIGMVPILGLLIVSRPIR